MRSTFALPLALAASLSLSACDDPAMRDQVGTATASGFIGAVAATALGASDAWVVVAAAAAGTAGALYARNQQTNECAYHTGDGETVTVSTC